MNSGTICDKASINLDIRGKENVHFSAADGAIILATYTVEGSFYSAVSFDGGHKFTQPRRILGKNGDLKEMKVLAKGRQFVVAIVERLSEKDVKRAVAGWMDPQDETFSFRQCTTYVYDQIIDISLGFRPFESGKIETPERKNKYAENDESVDYVFYRDGGINIKIDVQGHGSPFEVATFARSNADARYQL
jgi:hypothetical protein